MQAPEGTLISYATQPNSVAQDGIDGNSPYSKALAETIRTPGLDIFQSFNRVGVVVKNATGGSQQPWIAISPIEGEFFFAGRGQEKGDPQSLAGPLLHGRERKDVSRRPDQLGSNAAHSPFLR